MDELLNDKEFTLDLVLTRNLIDCVSYAIQDVIDSCRVSLLRFPSGNALLITWCSDDPISPRLFRRLVEIARFVQQEHGRTQIYLRHYRKQTILSWKSTDLVNHFRSS